MKIKKITIKNNPILWNIDLDFQKRDWTISNTILFVWENWSWKSTLLNIIYDFCNLENPKLAKDESRGFLVEMNHEEYWAWDYVFIFDKNYNSRQYKDSWMNNVSITYWSKNINTAAFILWNDSSKKALKWVFSDVSINFNTEEIKSITNLNTDEIVDKSLKSSSKTAQDIKQLFVDIMDRDWIDLTKRVDENDWIAPPKGIKHIRLDRFKNAFNYMFKDENLEFSWQDWLTPTFKKKWWEDIWIDKLSSWEKQIAYRWWFLLKDRNSLGDSIILIDEPEISMHPLWQEKILNFYKNLFRYDDQSIISQMFVTTHSPYVLWSMDYKNDKIFTFPWGTEVSNIKKYLWRKPSLALLNYKIFNIPTTDLFIELYWYIQEQKNLLSLKDMDEQLKQWWFDQNNKWIQYNKNIKWPEEKNYTIFTFIRNSIHHPENPYWNREYTKQELKESIENLIKLIDIYHI